MIQIDLARIEPDSLEFVTFLRNNKKSVEIRKIINSLGEINKLLVNLKIFTEPPKSYTELNTIFNMPVPVLKSKIRACLRKIHQDLVLPNHGFFSFKQLYSEKDLPSAIATAVGNHKHPILVVSNLKFLKSMGFSFLDFLDEIKSFTESPKVHEYLYFKRVMQYFVEIVKNTKELNSIILKKELKELDTVFHNLAPAPFLRLLNKLEIYTFIDLKTYPIGNFEKMETVGENFIATVKKFIEAPPLFWALEQGDKMMHPRVYECYYIYKRFSKQKT